jgi:hypothetical protein
MVIGRTLWLAADRAATKLVRDTGNSKVIVTGTMFPFAAWSGCTA